MPYYGSREQVAGRVILVDRYSRSLIRQQSERLFVFGDNLMRVGYGGQAAEARGELNVVGIPTKISPNTYFNDSEEHFIEAKKQIVQAFVILAQHLQNNKDVVWPKDGVGTGLAQLPRRAPLIWDGLEACRKQLFSMASCVIEYTS